ncbi:rhythmically expressed gene 2 protein [Drosophila miranda]|uniref:rhythmically expressed gene 2 protein n=1 Tax=Drosophila miranda TaxID=7229 RepID=UPI0007E848D5|nr:rhythmically expressed gene 2 protein [Drosophila miranda]
MSLKGQFMQNLRRFRLVTFDVTDTLLKLEDPPKQYQKTAAECGVTGLDRQQLERCFRQQFKIMSKEYPNFGRSSPNLDWQSWWLQLVSGTFRCVDASLPADKLATIGQQLVRVFRTSAGWRHVDGAAELVQSVRDSGKCVGIISNFDPSLPQVLQAMGFAGKFDFILTSYEAGVMKPDARIFKMPLERLNISPDQALHIGNKFDMDYAGARNSGWSGLLVQPKEGNKQGDKHSFASLATLLKALETQEIVW